MNDQPAGRVGGSPDLKVSSEVSGFECTIAGDGVVKDKMGHRLVFQTVAVITCRVSTPDISADHERFWIAGEGLLALTSICDPLARNQLICCRATRRISYNFV